MTGILTVESLRNEAMFYFELYCTLGYESITSKHSLNFLPLYDYSQLIGVLTNGVGKVNSKCKIEFWKVTIFLTCAFDVEICLFVFAAKINVNSKPVYTIMHALSQNVFLTPHFRWFKKYSLTVLKNTNFKVTYYMYRTISLTVYLLFILIVIIFIGNVPEKIFPHKTLLILEHPSLDRKLQMMQTSKPKKII